MDDYIIPAIVTAVAAYQFAHIARSVGNVRMKLKFAPPKTQGEPEFERAHRAQQNCVEFAPIFFPIFWVSSFYFHPVLASIPGGMYIYGRHLYFKGYSKAAQDRLPGFYIATSSLRILLIMSVIGLIIASLRRYADIDLHNYVTEYSGGYL